MNTDPTPFLFEGEHLVRVVQTGERDPWFVAADICRVLGLAQAASAVRSLDEDEKGVHISHTLGGEQQVLIVSESGLYALIFRSRKPAAVRFRRWVTGEVLPAIRKTGTYASRPVANDGEIEVPPVAQDFPNWPLDEWRVKIATADRYDRMYGKLAGQWIMPQLGFPTPPRELIQAAQLDLLNWHRDDDPKAA